MKIMWISPNGGSYKKDVLKGTGGWIVALQEAIIKREKNIELGIAFLHPTAGDKTIDGAVTYFPIKYNEGGKARRILNHFCRNQIDSEKIITDSLKKIIDDFQPDVIHIWGIENVYASIIPFINRPFVVHIQGLLSLYLSAYLPYGFSKNDLLKSDFPGRLLLHAGSLRDYKNAQYRAKREIILGRYVKNWIGRTDWDYTASKVLSPDSRYFHGEEMMRIEFAEKRWRYHFDGKTIRIQSSISGEWYKGMDVVLQTARLMTSMGYSFKWNVYGVVRNDYRLNYFIKKLGIVPESVGVSICGKVDGQIIRDGLLSSDLYVHPSYIENSSNSIVEAMMLGVPVIAQYVGGNPSILKNSSGVLVAPNEPYIMAGKIIEMCTKEIAEKYSRQALIVAEERQDPDKIVEGLISIYKEILKG